MKSGIDFQEMIPKPGQRVTLIGQTGSGKTTLLKKLLGAWYMRAQIHVLDIKHDHAFSNLDALYITKFSQLNRKFPFPKYPLIIFRPSGEEAHDLERMDKYFEWIFQRGNSVLAVDEVTQATSGTMPGAGFMDLLTRGRIRKCTVLLGTQRPVYAPRIIFSESQKFFVFRVIDRRDRSTVAGYTDERLKQEVTDSHGFWYVDISGRKVEYFSMIPI